MLNNLIPVEWSNQRVLTTKQLAEFEGVHYFKLAGAARHAKMINTQQAWDVMRELVDFYFANKTVEPPPVQDSLFPDVEPVKPKKRRPAPKLAVVYVVEFENGWSKLGFTGNLTERIDKLMELTKLDYSRWFATAPMSLEDAKQLESSLKARFADYHLQGEFYSAPFDDIKNALNFAHASPADKLIALAAIVKSR